MKWDIRISDLFRLIINKLIKAFKNVSKQKRISLNDCHWFKISKLFLSDQKKKNSLKDRKNLRNDKFIYHLAMFNQLLTDVNFGNDEKKLFGIQRNSNQGILIISK